jgi:hypothetical protein
MVCPVQLCLSLLIFCHARSTPASSSARHWWSSPLASCPIHSLESAASGLEHIPTVPTKLASLARCKYPCRSLPHRRKVESPGCAGRGAAAGRGATCAARSVVVGLLAEELKEQHGLDLSVPGLGRAFVHFQIHCFPYILMRRSVAQKKN